jgi:uncharacterized tellurite resistance protein B-like protein
VSLFFLPTAIIVVLVALLVALAGAVYRAIVVAIRIRVAEFQVIPNLVQPGEGIRVRARIIPRGKSPVFVRATLTCTMFDHRARPIYSNTHGLTSVFGRPGEYAAFVQMPAYALRTGVVGDKLSTLFSEDAHRLLIFWSIDLEVVDADGRVLLRESIPIDVPEGRPLQPDRAYMEQLIVETCGAMHSDLIFNWLVHLAMSDGAINAHERRLLHDVLRNTHGIIDPQAADARIAVETQRDLQIDPTVLRKHLPPEALVSFYRFLYAMAWRDGQLDGQEHDFLVDVLEKFGLDAVQVRQVEKEVLHGIGQHTLR